MHTRQFVRCVQHLLVWWPRTQFEITLETIGFYKRAWDEEDKCYTCSGTGAIVGDHPHHLYEWARKAGATCRKCSGHGRVIRLYEERITYERSFIGRRSLLFCDVNGVVHLTTKKGKVRRTRCSEFKELPEKLLSAFGQSTCMTCLAWTG